MNKKPLIIGIGELLWDVLPTGKKAGGAPVNFAYHASRFGAEAYAISAVGNDPLGDEILTEIERIRIPYIVERVDYPTGTVIVELRDGIPNYTIIEGVAWDHIPLTDEMKQLAECADAICFGTLAQRAEESRITIQTLLSHVPEESLRVYDINLRQHYYSRELIVASLRHCNVFKINDDELELLRGIFGLESDTMHDFCRRFVKLYNLRYLIFTAGADYSAVFSLDEESFIDTPRVEVVDTVGAGDSFTGAFIASVLSGRPLAEAHLEAVNHAAYVCTQAGAWV